MAWCDLKTTMSLNHAQFLHQFKKLKYRIQAALYTDIMAHNGADFSRGSYLTAGYNSNILYIAASTKEDHIFMTEVSESTLKEGMIDIKSALLEL